MFRKRIPAALLALALLMTCATGFAAPLEGGQPVETSAPSVLLLEAPTGTVIFEKDADSRRQVASLTKLMTLLLVFESLESGHITLKDSVTVSKQAAAQKGSGALLDADTAYPLNDLLKCTIIASANDAAYALAEYLAGTEEAFVQMMNTRAAELGMADTVYVNCTGLPQEGQHTTARDIGTLSCQVCLHPAYYQYASVWLDTLKHPSGRITDLTNTNRLVRFYQDCDGLKTGSTDAALYCLSATAEKNGLRLIAVVLAAPTSQKRFDDARAMLDYGFSSYSRVLVLKEGEYLGMQVPVTRGERDAVDAAIGKGLSMLLKPAQKKELSMQVELAEMLQAPVAMGQTIGLIRVSLAGQEIAKIPAVAAYDVPRPGFLESLHRILDTWR